MLVGQVLAHQIQADLPALQCPRVPERCVQERVALVSGRRGVGEKSLVMNQVGTASEVDTIETAPREIVARPNVGELRRAHLKRRAVKASDNRAKRLASSTAADNRISYGCINVHPAFYEGVVKRLFAPRDGIVYVLPETRPIETLFSKTTETAAR